MRIGSLTFGESKKRQGTTPYSSDEAHLEVTVLFDDDAESRDQALTTAKEFVKRGLVDEPSPKAAKAPAKPASPAPHRIGQPPAPKPAAPSTPPTTGAKPGAPTPATSPQPATRMPSIGMPVCSACGLETTPQQADRSRHDTGSVLCVAHHRRAPRGAA